MMSDRASIVVVWLALLLVAGCRANPLNPSLDAIGIDVGDVAETAVVVALALGGVALLGYSVARKSRSRRRMAKSRRDAGSHPKPVSRSSGSSGHARG